VKQFTSSKLPTREAKVFFSSSAEGLMFDLDWGGGVSKGHSLA
jgi:hypothetical protein